MQILFIGKYQDSEIFNGPEKVAKRIFTEMQNVTKDVYFADYFSNGNKYNILNKLFGREKINENVDRFGIFRLLFFIIKNKPKIIHIITYERFSIIACFAKLFYKTKIFYHVHGIIRFEERFKINRIPIFLKFKDRITEHLIFKFANKLFFLSEESLKIAKKYYNINNDKVIFINNGVDDVFFNHKKNFKNKRINILCLAETNRPEKGLNFTINFLNNLNTKSNIFIFDKSFFEVKNKMIKIFKINKMDTKTYAEFLSKIDFLYSSSIYDTFQISVIEAMAMGVIPIISKNVGSKILINQNKNGFVFHFNENKEVYNFIDKINQNEVLKQKTSRNAIKSVKNLRWIKIAETIYENYYL